MKPVSKRWSIVQRATQWAADRAVWPGQRQTRNHFTFLFVTFRRTALYVKGENWIRFAGERARVCVCSRAWYKNCSLTFDSLAAKQHSQLCLWWEQFTDIWEDINPRRTIYSHLWSWHAEGCKDISFSVAWKYAQKFLLVPYTRAVS